MTDRAEVPLRSAISELYGGPLDDFVRSRDALARELRTAGNREAASQVKSLRKPSRPAWALNRIANQAPASVSALEAAVADIIDAHAGSGDARAAMAILRATIRDCASHAADESRSAGFNLDTGDLSNAILAVLGNPRSYAELRSGCLTDVPDAGGFDFLGSLPAPPKLEVSEPRRPSPPQVDEAEVATAREQARLASMALDVARRAAESAASALNEANSEVASAQERARLAESELKAAQQRLEFVRRKNESATDELRKADAASREADSRLERLAESGSLNRPVQ